MKSFLSIFLNPPNIKVHIFYLLRTRVINFVEKDTAEMFPKWEFDVEDTLAENIIKLMFVKKPWKWTMDCWEVTGTWVNTKPAVVSPAKKKVVKEDSPRPRKKARKEAPAEASEEAAAEASEEAAAEASEEAAAEASEEAAAEASEEAAAEASEEAAAEASEEAAAEASEEAAAEASEEAAAEASEEAAAEASEEAAAEASEEAAAEASEEAAAEASEEAAAEASEEAAAEASEEAAAEASEEAAAEASEEAAAEASEEAAAEAKDIKTMFKDIADAMRVGFGTCLKEIKYLSERVEAVEKKIGITKKRKGTSSQNTTSPLKPMLEPGRHIVVFDSICSSISPEELDVVMEPFLYMVPYLLVECASSDEVRAQYSLEPFTYERPTNIPPARAGDCGVYTLKYIECHALGIEFSKKDFAKPNGKCMRDKMAVDIFQELPDVHEFKNKDMDDILGTYDG
uniref:Ubiquitin-like protease family profile domain-containing protein n=2 Tax=Brassica oleracea var. oleracea TaxID=109376 RepID=A0A0D3CI90_BRAOL